MKANEVDILIISDAADAGGDYWQTRWEVKLSTAQKVILPAEDKPDLSKWADIITEIARNCARPIVVIAHSWGIPAVMYALPHLGEKICGGFFVCPPDINGSDEKSERAADVRSYPHSPLPFPSIVIASRNDLSGNYEKTERLAAEWRSLFMDAGDSGHIDAESGYGPWPEGLMVFSQFLANLPKPAEHKPIRETENKIEKAEEAALKNRKE